jgi:hypothetical protein
MLIPFDDLSPQARIWIYQSTTPIPDQVLPLTKAFVKDWTAHQQALKASAAVLKDHFLVLAVDEDYQSASGCSIDKSVHFIQELENRFGLHFFDRLQVAYLEGEKLRFKSQSALKTEIGAGQFTVHTLVFNNLVTTKGQLDTEWCLPAGHSWLSRLF